MNVSKPALILLQPANRALQLLLPVTHLSPSTTAGSAGLGRCEAQQSSSTYATSSHPSDGNLDDNSTVQPEVPGDRGGWASYDDSDEQAADPASRDKALRRVLRSSNAAELAAVHFFRGYSAALHRRVDAQFFCDQEQQAAEGVRQLLPRYRVRPSLAQGPLSLACLALGAAAGAAGSRLGLAVTGAVGDALTEHYNEQLRQLNEAGAAQQAPDVRQALRSLRDLPRTPEGAPPAPDLVSVLKGGIEAASGGGGSEGGAGASAGAAARAGPTFLTGIAGAVREWGLEGTVGAVVKAGTKVALSAASRL